MLFGLLGEILNGNRRIATNRVLGEELMCNEGSCPEFEGSDGPFAPLPRPEGQLRSLAVAQRWEVTRRHPYYLIFWPSSQKFHRREPIECPMDALLREVAVAILGSIGAGGPPFDPVCDFDEISRSDQGTHWLAGSVHPVAFRGLMGLLIAALPATTLGGIGEFLTRYFSQASGDDRRMDALLEWARFTDTQLDQYPDAPILSISPSASIRSLERDLPIALRTWTDRPDQIEYRQSSARFDDYLRVWDLREGWNQGRYDSSAERLLRDVASELRISISTATNRYRSAFELITGHPYSPVTWLRVFGGLKLSSAFTNEIGRIAARRPTRSPSRAPIPESVISPMESSVGLVASHADHSEDSELANRLDSLVQEINTLFDRGMSNSDIVAHYGIEDEYAAQIQQLRERYLEQ